MGFPIRQNRGKNNGLSPKCFPKSPKGKIPSVHFNPYQVLKLFDKSTSTVVSLGK